MLTLGEIADEAGRRFGDKASFVSADGWELSYADLARLSDEVAMGFLERGIGEVGHLLVGEVVALLRSDTWECDSLGDVAHQPAILHGRAEHL